MASAEAAPPCTISSHRSSLRSHPATEVSLHQGSLWGRASSRDPELGSLCSVLGFNLGLCFQTEIPPQALPLGCLAGSVTRRGFASGVSLGVQNLSLVQLLFRTGTGDRAGRALPDQGTARGREDWEETGESSSSLACSGEAAQVRLGHKETKTGGLALSWMRSRDPSCSITILPSQGTSLGPALPWQLHNQSWCLFPE